MSELAKLIKRARYCKNTGETFIWDNSWLNECEEELNDLLAKLDEAIAWHEGDCSPHAELEQTIAQLRAEKDEWKNNYDVMLDNCVKFRDENAEARELIKGWCGTDPDASAFLAKWGAK